MYLTNALPASVLVDPEGSTNITITPIKAAYVAALWVDGVLVSAIGHEDTAALVSDTLAHAPGYGGDIHLCAAEVAQRIEVPMARVSMAPLEEGEALIAALDTGPRLPEGSKTLPPGAALTFYQVRRSA